MNARATYFISGASLTASFSLLFHMGWYSPVVATGCIGAIAFIAKRPIFNQVVVEETVKDSTNSFVPLKKDMPVLRPNTSVLDEIVVNGLKKLDDIRDVTRAFGTLELACVKWDRRKLIKEENERIDKKVSKIIKTTRDVVDQYAAGNFDLIHSNLRKFFTVYIDTLEESIRAYDKILKTPVIAADIDNVPTSIIDMLKTMESIIKDSIRKETESDIAKIAMASEKLQQMQEN